MGNLKLRKLIARDTIYKDKHKEFRHICKFEVHSILKVFNGAKVVSGKTITISATTNGYLSEEDKKIITDKGWTISVKS